VGLCFFLDGGGPPPLAECSWRLLPAALVLALQLCCTLLQKDDDCVLGGKPAVLFSCLPVYSHPDVLSFLLPPPGTLETYQETLVLLHPPALRLRLFTLNIGLATPADRTWDLQCHCALVPPPPLD
jgi:hypothetical protein